MDSSWRAGTNRRRFKTIKSRIFQLSDEFHKNLAHSDLEAEFYFSCEELDGLPGDILADL